MSASNFGVMVWGALLGALLISPGAGRASPGEVAPNASDEDLSAAPFLAAPPELIELVPAEVPAETVFPDEDVIVVLVLEVDETGSVREVALEQGFGAPFDEAATAAARQFEFAPGILNTGEAVPVTVTFRMLIPPPPPQPASYVGRLVERGTRNPLGDVPVAARLPRLSEEEHEEHEEDAPESELPPAAFETVAETVTDADGRFELALMPGRVWLVALPPAHERLEIALDLEPGERLEESFFLQRTGEAFEVVVRAARVRREVTRQVISRDVVTQVPGTQGDTIKVVFNFPGVARDSFGAGTLVLRGASPGDSLVFLEGLEIPLIYHFGGLRSTFNNYFLEAVEFVPGNFAVDYGRATGGIIDVRVRDPASDMFRGAVDLNVYDAGFALEGPLSDEWSMGGAFHRSYIDALLPLVLPDDVPLSFDVAPRYYDYQFLTTWQPRRDDGTPTGQRARLVWFGSLDKVELLFDSPRNDPKLRGRVDGRIMFHNALLQYGSDVTPWLRQESQLSFGFNQISATIGADFFFDLDFFVYAARSAWTARALPWLALRLGADIVLTDFSISLAAPSPPREGENSVPVATQGTIGATRSSLFSDPALFLDMLIEPTPRLSLIPGVRVDYWSLIDAWAVDPRLSGRYQLFEATALKAGVGLYQQPPTPDEADSAFGTPTLLPQRSVQASLGVEQRIIDGLEIEVTGFYKWIDRVIVRNPDPAARQDLSADTYTNDGTGRIFGLEVLLRASFGSFERGFTGWLAYTFQRSYRTDAPGLSERLFDFDQPHILTALGTYRIGWGVSVGARFRFVSGNPSTPVLGAIYDAGTDTYVPLYGRSNSTRLAHFHALDVRIDKVWTFERWKLELYLDVQNIYNNANQEGWSYSYDYSQRARLTGLPILPILGIRGEW